jgi:hypothetical protein
MVGTKVEEIDRSSIRESEFGMPPTNYRASEHGFSWVMLIILCARTATDLDDGGFGFVKH